MLMVFEVQGAVAADCQSNGPEGKQVCQIIIQPSVMRQGEMRAVVAEDPEGGGLSGHAMAWDNNGTLAMGPLVARDDVTARALAETLTRGAKGRRVRMDLFPASTDLSLWAEERGIVPVRQVPMMSLGGRELPGKRHHLYTLTLQALG